MNYLRLCTFNCRSVKSSICEVQSLCNDHDIVCLQEHWLLPNELNLLSNIHPEFMSTGISAVDVSRNILVGRPFGGTAILYRKDLLEHVNILSSTDPRITAIQLQLAIGPVLFVSVYMPTDMNDDDSSENYIATCANIHAMFAESDAVHACISGDFNCQRSSRFFAHLSQLASDLNLMLSDLNRLNNDAITYCSDSGLNTSWIDHILCTSDIDNAVIDTHILYDFVSSDHKPLVMTLQLSLTPTNVSCNVDFTGQPTPDWSLANDYVLALYNSELSAALTNVDVPAELLGLNLDNITCNREKYCSVIDNYYNNIIECIHGATMSSIPHRIRRKSEYIVPGWSDIVEEKHDIARQTFMDWVYLGKPRQGVVFLKMKRTRASFKLAMRYCRQHEEQLRSDACARDLSKKDFKSFWNSVNKLANDKATKYASCVGGAVGAINIANMWGEHFEQLYNSVNDGGAMELFQNRLAACNTSSPSHFHINVLDILDVVNKQKKGKSAGPDGIQMEALIFGGLKLYVHLSLLFNMFVHCNYLPKQFMHSVIIPLVKCKSGNLNDLDNYRAIAISTALSKVFEGLLLAELTCHINDEERQFGFKSGHSTGMCTNVLKRTVEYFTERGSHVFTCFIDFSKAFDKVNYWKLFNKLLDDRIDVNIVAILSFWYSQQEVCVRWQSSVSSSFKIGNGTRQGSVLSPLLFARYICELLAKIFNTRIGCNIGGIYYNILAYADDLVLVAPSWSALQHLINVLHREAADINMSCNVNKTVCMVFSPKCRRKVIRQSFPVFKLGDSDLQFVKSFKYLGHIICHSFSDDDDVKREIRNMYTRTNILIRRYSRCSLCVKLVLFKSYCICMYDTALWKTYSIGVYNKLRSCYNKCIKMFFGYKRSYSVTQMLNELEIPSFDTIIANSLTIFDRQWVSCTNSLLVNLTNCENC